MLRKCHSNVDLQKVASGEKKLDNEPAILCFFPFSYLECPHYQCSLYFSRRIEELPSAIRWKHRICYRHFQQREIPSGIITGNNWLLRHEKLSVILCAVAAPISSSASYLGIVWWSITSLACTTIHRPTLAICSFTSNVLLLAMLKGRAWSYGHG